MSTSISILDLANVYLNDPLNDIQFITDINFYNDDFYSVYNNNIVLGGTGRNKVVIGTSNIDTDVKLYVEGDSMFNSNVDITCNLTVEGNSFFNSNVDITCNLKVEGTITGLSIDASIDTDKINAGWANIWSPININFYYDNRALAINSILYLEPTSRYRWNNCFVYGGLTGTNWKGVRFIVIGTSNNSNPVTLRGVYGYYYDADSSLTSFFDTYSNDGSQESHFHFDIPSQNGRGPGLAISPWYRFKTNGRHTDIMRLGIKNVDSNETAYITYVEVQLMMSNQ